MRVFSPCGSFVCHSQRLSVRMRGNRSRRHNSSSKQKQSQPNLLAATVIIVALGRSLYFYLFPSRLQYLVSTASNPAEPATESMNRKLLASYLMQYYCTCNAIYIHIMSASTRTNILMRPHKTRGTRDRSMPHSLQR